MLAILATFLPVLFENVALAFAGYLAFGGSVPGGGGVPAISGGVGCTIAQPPPVGAFPVVMRLAREQPSLEPDLHCSRW